MIFSWLFLFLEKTLDKEWVGNELGPGTYSFHNSDILSFLYAYFKELDAEAYGWMSWPEEYQNHDSAAVKNF